MQHKRQSGSTLVFVICAVVLVLIALGVLCGVRRVAMNDQTPPMMIPEGSGSLRDQNDQNDQNGQTEKPAGNGNTDTAPNDSTPAENGTTNSSDGSTSNESSSSNSSSTGTGSTQGSQHSTTGQGNLPVTGPEHAFLTAAALALTTTAIVAYVRSRALI